MSIDKYTTVGILGGSGYTGEELIKILSKHPKTLIKAVSSRGLIGKSLNEIYPDLDEDIRLSFVEHSESIFEDCDYIFFATPHGVSMKLTKKYLSLGIKIIDLSADFRLQDKSLWKKWYSADHSDPSLLKVATYGLVELNGISISKSSLVSVPGCYPTAALLGLLPILRTDFKIKSITIDAKSGISGAGRKKVEDNYLNDMKDNFKAYSVDGHRHLPEIKQEIDKLYGEGIDISFQPHLIPTMRGLYVSSYIQIENLGDINLFSLYKEFYKNSCSVHILNKNKVPSLHGVIKTNRCEISVHRTTQPDQLLVLSCIDNLVKGAAGQAVECYNLMEENKVNLGLAD
tara:strand:- start:4279 stop:5310 length:1032 start_codon:yes stop_codon:yes gene_type:complete